MQSHCCSSQLIDADLLHHYCSVHSFFFSVTTLIALSCQRLKGGFERVGDKKKTKELHFILSVEQISIFRVLAVRIHQHWSVFLLSWSSATKIWSHSLCIPLRLTLTFILTFLIKQKKILLQWTL